MSLVKATGPARIVESNGAVAGPAIGSETLLARSPVAAGMAQESSGFAEKEYLLLVLVGVAVLMAATGAILVLTSV